MLNSVYKNGKKYVCRIYDDGGETFDRYTICLKAYRSYRGLIYPYLAASTHPFDAHGFGQHGENDTPIDGKHLGKRIAFEDCPKDVQDFILQNLGKE